jgi:thioredoxin-dependent peroxiredoxin
MIDVGEFAPDFTALTDAGVPITLAALRGRPVVLYFYPKDDTPG